MDARRAQFARHLARRRRLRLLLVCVALAAACGTTAGIIGPRILIGGMSVVRPGSQPQAELPLPAKAPEAAAAPFDLALQLGLDPREQQANAIRWKSMVPEARRDLLDRYWSLAAMDPDRRQSLVRKYEEFRSLPEERRRFLRDRAQTLREFVASLSPQDQAVLEGMGDEARARRVLELWQARYGQW